jgi:protein PhnA
MSEGLPSCPKCGSEYTYPDGALLVCPECAHEWSPEADAAKEADEADEAVVRDSVGNVLRDGDSVIVVKTLKVKGGPGPLKAGTKVKNIRLVEGDHDIDCQIPGFGAMKLKSEIVRKA